MSNRRSIGLLSLALLLFATAVTAQESSPTPPTDLKKVGDHWTPWDPPAAGPADYIIQKDDTLWDLAEAWLGDPFLWPQIWDLNRYILDSHWIYPGDPLVIPGKPTVIPPEGPPDVEPDGDDGEGEAPTAEAGPTEGEPGEGVAVAEPEPAPLLPVAADHDVYCSGFIDPSGATSAVQVAGRELERRAVGQGDVIYLTQGRNQGIEAGSEWQIRRRTQRVEHPVTGADLGRYVRRLGRARVLAAQAETAIAVIDMSCDDVRDGDELVPWEAIPIPLLATLPPFERYAVEPSGGASGYVVATSNPVHALGTGHVIHIDLGDAAGVQPGDVFTLYRENGDLPRLMLGQAVVLTVEPGTATARIARSVRESTVGDRVEALR